MRIADTRSLAALLQPHAQQPQHAAFDALLDVPETPIGEVIEPLLPVRRIGQSVAPVPAELQVEDVLPALKQERGCVHAVGDVADRVVGRRHLGPCVRAYFR
jgi:hypothetical protein